jgi:drug/metabolite transporter (DMT)-like permease
MKKQNNSGFWAILLSAIIYGAYGVLARYLDGAFGYFTQVLFRSAVALLIVAVFVFVSRTKFSLSKKDSLKAVLLGLSFFGGVVLFTVGSILDKISVVMFVFYAGSFATSFFVSTYYYREKVTLQKGIALGIVLVGLVITTGLDFSNLSWGLLAAFGSGVLDAIANNFRKQLADLPKQEVLLLQFAIASVLSLLFIMLTKEVVIKDITTSAVVAGIAWGIFWIIGNQLIMIGYRHFDFLLAQIVLSSEIFFATVLAFFFFREIPNSFELIGGILIFVGVCVVDINFSNLKQKLNGARERI